MKRIALAISSPMGIIFSIFTMTENESWCIVLLILSIIMLFVGIFLQYKNRYETIKVVSYLISVLLLGIISSINLHHIESSKDDVSAWASELEKINNSHKIELKHLYSADVKDIHTASFEYIYGLNGKPKDFDQAESLLRLAIDRGYQKASYTLGEMYLYGLGHTVDSTRAYNIFLNAVRNGHFEVVDAIQILSENNSKIKKLSDIDLSYFFEKYDILMNLIGSIEDPNRYWLFNMTSEHLIILEQLSDYGFTLADKILVYTYGMFDNKYNNREKGKVFAKRLYDRGYKPVSQMEQVLFIQLLEPELRFNKFTAMELADKYNFYLPLMFESEEHNIKKHYIPEDIHARYQYCRKQYESALFKLNNIGNFEYTVFSIDKATCENQLQIAKDMLLGSIMEIENELNKLY